MPKQTWKMPWRYCRCLVVLWALLSWVAYCLSADKKQLEAALAAVEANLKTPAGKQYDAQLGKEFMDRYLPGLKQCKQGLPAGTKIDSFEMFMKIKSSGQVAEVLVYPESQFAGCTRTRLRSGNFSVPPHDDYWVNVHIQMKH
jgi:hypothetical protein